MNKVAEIRFSFILFLKLPEANQLIDPKLSVKATIPVAVFNALCGDLQRMICRSIIVRPYTVRNLVELTLRIAPI